MSENPHNSNLPAAPPAKSVGKPDPWRQTALWATLFGVTLLLVVLIFAKNSQTWMNGLARSEPDLQRRQAQDGLRVTRALLKPKGFQDGDTLLWEARRSGREAGFFLGGGVRAELAGRPDEARLWLAADALARKDQKRARAWLAPIRPTINVDDRAMPDPDRLESQELGRRLKESLAVQR